MSRILHQNSFNIAMIRDDFKTRSQVKVVHDCDGQQFCHRKYRFALIQEPVEVPYSSWANLDCCGGWSYDTDYLNTAVQKGLKLFAGDTTCMEELYCGPIAKGAEERLAELGDSLPAGVFAGMEYRTGDTDRPYTFICREGTILDYIDLDLVFSFYEKLGVHISGTEKKEIEHLCGIEMKHFGSDENLRWCTLTWVKTQLITTGLLYGYPIESTVSILQGH